MKFEEIKTIEDLFEYIDETISDEEVDQALLEYAEKTGQIVQDPEDVRISKTEIDHDLFYDEDGKPLGFIEAIEVLDRMLYQ